MIFLKTIVSFLKDDDYRDLLITSLVVLGVGSAVYRYLEGWDWLDLFFHHHTNDHRVW